MKSQLEADTRKSTVNKGKVDIQIQVAVFSNDIGFQRFRHPPSSWYSEGDTLSSGEFPYKCKCLL